MKGKDTQNLAKKPTVFPSATNDEQHHDMDVSLGRLSKWEFADSLNVSARFNEKALPSIVHRGSTQQAPSVQTMSFDDSFYHSVDNPSPTTDRIVIVPLLSALYFCLLHFVCSAIPYVK